METNRKRTLLDKFKDIVWMIQLLCPSISIAGIVTLIVQAIRKQLSVLNVILLALLIALTVAISIKMLWDWRSYKSYRYPWRTIRTYNYEFLEKEYLYDRDEKTDELRYSRTVQVKSKIANLDHINDKFIWTGAQTNNMQGARCLNVHGIKGIGQITPSKRLGMWDHIELKLEPSINGKGSKSARLTYEWDPIPNCKSSSEFFSASTDIPTQKLRLILRLGQEYHDQKIICEEYRSSDSDIVLRSAEHELDWRGEYTWEIPKKEIKRFRYYLIRWNWKPGAPPVETISTQGKGSII